MYMDMSILTGCLHVGHGYELWRAIRAVCSSSLPTQCAWNLCPHGMVPMGSSPKGSRQMGHSVWEGTSLIFGVGSDDCGPQMHGQGGPGP